MKTIRVALRSRSYDICIGSGLLKTCGAALKKLRIGTDAVVITNRRLWGLYGKRLQATLRRNGFSVRFEIVPDSEKAKSVRIAAKLLTALAEYDVRRRVFIIALGGGVVGDLAGFVAATYKRGIPYVQIPTTLLAQVDSAIGGKVAIDLAVAKNLAGAFYQPRIVISDISLVKTLPPRQVRSGIAEIIKYGVIKDPKLFRFLETGYREVLKLDTGTLEYVIAASSRIKAAVVAKDEFDRTGARAILNYGHTIGHAIEAASGYSDRFSHGEAVAIGMAAASRISASLGIFKEADADRIEALLKKTGLPVKAEGLKPAAVYGSHLHDKKFIRGTNRFVLPVKIGSVRVVEGVPERIVKSVIRDLVR